MTPHDPGSRTLYNAGCRCSGCSEVARTYRKSWKQGFLIRAMSPTFDFSTAFDPPPETPDWQIHGVCTTVSTRVKAYFFSEYKRQTLLAKRYCARCPVREECLRQAMHLERFEKLSGVWGGTTAIERVRLMKDHREKLK